MKVKISYDKKLLRVPVVLLTPHKRVVSNFVIDTGSPHTIINYKDSLRLAIPHIQKSELVRIAGKVYQSYVYERVEIIFKTLEGKEMREKIPVRVLKLFSLRFSEIENLDKLPNLLGLDFLEKGYKLVCNMKEADIFIEKIL